MGYNSPEQIEKYIQYAKNLLHGKEIMFMYFGGSIAYGTYIEGKSDIDINLIVDGFDGFIHSTIQGCDFFIYGNDYYMKKQNFDKELPLYYKSYIDEVLAIDRTLIYLNPKYQKEFDEYKNINLESRLKEFLEIFVAYHEDVLNRKVGVPSKRLYHIIRMRGIIENYQKTGKYTLEVVEPYASLLFKFKENWKEGEGYTIYQTTIIPSLKYLKNYCDQLKGG